MTQLIGTYNGIRVFDLRNSHNINGMTAGDVAISQSLDGTVYGQRIVWDGSRANDMGIRGIDNDLPALFAAAEALEFLMALEEAKRLEAAVRRALVEPYEAVKAMNADGITRSTKKSTRLVSAGFLCGVQ